MATPPMKTHAETARTRTQIAHLGGWRAVGDGGDQDAAEVAPFTGDHRGGVDVQVEQRRVHRGSPGSLRSKAPPPPPTSI